MPKGERGLQSFALPTRTRQRDLRQLGIVQVVVVVVYGVISPTLTLLLNKQVRWLGQMSTRLCPLPSPLLRLDATDGWR